MSEPDIDPEYIPGSDYIFATDHAEDKGLLRDGDIVLVPQPTISPNDPLTWSSWRKYWHLIILLVVTGLTSATSNSASAAQQGIIDEYGFSWGIFNTGAGVLFIGIGYWTLLSAPSVFLWGSRINYIVGILLGIIGNAWYAKTSTVGDAIWSQLFIGASESVSEAVVQLSITQIFYQHQANHFIGIYVLAVSIGTFLGPMIGGFAADNIGWPWVGYLGLICSGFTLVLVCFGLEETYFDRTHFESKNKATLEAPHQRSIESNKESPEEEYSGQEKDQMCSYPPSSSSRTADMEIGPRETGVSGLRPELVDEAKTDIADKPKTYWQSIALITPAVNLNGWGFKQYIQRLWLMCRVLLFPPVLYSGLQWGAQDAWLTFYISVEDDYWVDPPWNYGDTGVAIMNVPSLIGAIIGCIYAGWITDYWVLWMAKRNGGLREAESRLWCLLPVLFLGPLGLFLLGAGTGRGWGWPAPYVGLGFIGFMWGCAGDVSMSYLIDCYPELVLEGMVGVSVINNTMGMIFSFVCDPWLSSLGPLDAMISVGVLAFFFIGLTIPMIIWGKSCRKLTRKYYYSLVHQRDSLNAS